MQRYVVEPIPMLQTEREAAYLSMRAEFRKDIEPKDSIERMYFNDFVYLVWETKRYRRQKIAICSLSMRNALFEVLVERLAVFEPGEDTLELLDKWFSEDEVRAEILEILARFGLDEVA